MRMLLAGNWKMNGLRNALGEIRALKRGLADEPARGDVLVCPPATLIADAVKAAEGGSVAIGGQDCHALASGAFTGDISAEMLRDAGATAVIVGHSERRQYHGETNVIVAGKVRAARRAGLAAILCVGESGPERDAGSAVAVVTEQLQASIPAELNGKDLVIAYEPIWAIGTGKTPQSSDVGQMHEAIRAVLKTRFGGEGGEMRILYGGSVKPENAADILALANVDGALIGGASLKAADFLAIIRAAPRR
ncbi:MAG TPA: triose-phosphate isomerase [Micropepsaceae bacterium]|jgi:triosephosphate isomerase